MESGPGSRMSRFHAVKRQSWCNSGIRWRAAAFVRQELECDFVRVVKVARGYATLALLASLAAWGTESVHTVPYVPPASSEGHAGVVRIESGSSRAGEVRVVAVDDEGRQVEAGRLAVGPVAALEFGSSALETGDATLGLTGTGSGEGDWRLELTTDLSIEAWAYARTEGLVTALHDAALVSGETGAVELSFFAADGGVLRFSNTGEGRATVTIRGIDDAGVAAGPVTAELGPGESASYAASELESGSAPGLTGSLGDGSGAWRLRLETGEGSLYATNVLVDGSGVLSSVPGGMSRGAGVLHRVLLFPAASDGLGRRGVVRVVNRSTEDADVSVEAFDETERPYGGLRLALESESSSEFDSPPPSPPPSLDSADLVVSVSTDNATLEPEESFTLSATVRNRGSGDAGPTTLHYHTSADSRITPMDLEAGMDTVDPLAASGTSTESIMLSARLSEGSYHYGACVDAVEGESDTSNNCSSAIEINVVAPLPADLRISSVDSAQELYWIGLEETATLFATVENAGETSTETATTLRHNLARWFEDPVPVGTAEVPPLDGSGVFSHQQEVPVPESPGDYFQQACVDTVPGEVSTYNNCRSSIAFEAVVPQSIGDFNVTIPRGCPLEVNICVQRGTRARTAIGCG